ncbi:helix-turn-helix domain-containing protein [Leuconostoc mesenteroides]|uniref:helix-turn-helix domain-containing protein n=1 Tax=Leuconostoc mesenteroides TaxID=1245 RepID=UPI000C998AF7|nr:helix-turn-helix transcriptional regulator [Leuconostoc mesenteroides]PND40535.1 transcriptional regulator [Leuconostoc mesenteroides]
MKIDVFGERLKAARKIKNMTQLGLSARLDVSKGTISAYEQASSYPSIETVVKLCEVLVVSSDYLLGLSDNLTFEIGGLTDEQRNSILQFISTLETANRIISKN